MDARDDLIVNDQYSLDAHHDEETGRKIRRKIWMVTALLTAITAVEIIMGIIFKKHDDIWPVIKMTFIIMTIVKAGYIVYIFMHLKDENKYLRRVILWPYVMFISYLMFICFTEGNFVHNMLSSYL